MIKDVSGKAKNNFRYDIDAVGRQSAEARRPADADRMKIPQKAEKFEAQRSDTRNFIHGV